MDPWKLASMFTKTSSTMEVAFTLMFLGVMPGVMLSRCWDGVFKMEWSIGSVLTLGEKVGARVDSSELQWENAT